MRIVIEIDNEAPVAQRLEVPAAESAPAVDGGAAPVTSASTTGAPVALSGAEVIDGGAAGGQTDTASDDTGSRSVPADAVDAGPGPQF
jgi:hypothetical protein